MWRVLHKDEVIVNTKTRCVLSVGVVNKVLTPGMTRGCGNVATDRAEQGTVQGISLCLIGLICMSNQFLLEWILNISSKMSKKTTVTCVEMSKKSLDNGEAGDNAVFTCMDGHYLLFRLEILIDACFILALSFCGYGVVCIPYTEFEAEIYVLTNDEGGLHTAFISNYRPRFYFRTANVTGKVDLLENVKMVMRENNALLLLNSLHQSKICSERQEMVVIGMEPPLLDSDLILIMWCRSSVYRELKEHKNDLLEFYGECEKENDKKVSAAGVKVTTVGVES
ncbi:elongation factor Tu, mitochondrial [Tanacetum coccineum]